MKLYIWEGDGISDAYHDDGTLVVLAETPEQAREIVRAGTEQRNQTIATRARLIGELAKSLGSEPWRAQQTEEGQAICRAHPYYSSGEFFDGADSALDREPDRVVEIDQPTWVAFNGGGYD